MQATIGVLKINLYAIKINDHAVIGKFSIYGMVFFLYTVYIKYGDMSCL